VNYLYVCTRQYSFMTDSPSQLLLDTSSRAPTAPHRWPPEADERRSRASEFYGFVAWTSTYLLFVLYILWAVLPDEWIQFTGVTWYPNRYTLSSSKFLRKSSDANFGIGNGHSWCLHGPSSASSLHMYLILHWQFDRHPHLTI